MTFLVLTPLGLQRAVEFAAALADRGIAVVRREPIGPWSFAATWLYARPARPGGLELAQRFEARWRDLDAADVAERWCLTSVTDHERLVAAKAELRIRFPGVPLDARRSDGPAFALHAFHVPEPDDVAVESRRLDAFVLTLEPAMR